MSKHDDIRAEWKRLNREVRNPFPDDEWEFRPEGFRDGPVLYALNEWDVRPIHRDEIKWLPVFPPREQPEGDE